jgi:multidrug transporter EmrE-like cation transporter
MNNFLPFLLLFIGGLVLTVGDITMKRWVENNNWLVFASGLLVYLVGSCFLAFSFKYENIAVASVIYVLFNIITLSLVSWLYFKEALSPTQIVGIALGLGVVAFLELA